MLPHVSKFVADLRFQRWILDDANLGDADTIVSRLHVALSAEGRPSLNCHVDLMQPVGSDYEEGQVEARPLRRCAKRTQMIGNKSVAVRRPECVGDGPEYGGPLNEQAFNELMVTWFRSRVKELRATGRLEPKPQRSPDSEFFGKADDRFEIE
jgi:hypothetical protein